MTSFRVLLGVHLTGALGATVAFWVAAFSFKGGPVHRSAGEWFRRLIYAAALTGALLAFAGIVAPAWGHPPRAGQTTDAYPAQLRDQQQMMWVVLYVLLLIVTPAQHGMATVRAGPEPFRLRSRVHAALNLSCLAGAALVVIASAAWQRWPFVLLAPIGFVIGLRDMSYASRRSALSIDWEREHLTSMVTSGVAMHTALLVFGASRTLGWELTPWGEAIVWGLPALLGLPAIAWLRARRTGF